MSGNKWDRSLGPLSDAALQAILDRRLPIMAEHVPQSAYTFADRFEQRAAERGDAVFLIDGERHLTWTEVEADSRRIAHAVRELGLGQGDVCALMVQNRIEFVTAMLGLIRAGIVVSLLNSSVAGAALDHAVREGRAKAIIVGSECLTAFDGVAPDVPRWIVPDDDATPDENAVNLIAHASKFGDAPIPPAWRAGLVGEDDALQIFTSGTTGLPKAARLSNMRWLIGGDVKLAMMELDASDVFYCFLPMFHGAVIMSLFASAVAAGGTIVIRRRFSASQFWEDVRAHGITVCQYVGEICRYLMNRPRRANDRDHTLRAITGTGLSAEMWLPFQERFGIPQIYEGWGSTEGNTSLVNYENVPGAIGRIADWAKANVRLVRYDVETGERLRDEAGRLMLCRDGEAGEAIARISHLPHSGAGRFEGYTSVSATESKIVRDAFEPGDAWFATGDALRREPSGHCFFVDRLGDTFRWKSENVSTQEVAGLLGDLPGLEMISVYGVRIPGAEGRAGMAALTMQPGAEFNPKAFHTLATERLSDFAVPLVVRIWSSPDFTASYKLRKVELQREGFDPGVIADPLYVRDREQATYVPFSIDALAWAAGVAPFALSGGNNA